jgi:hypothetical protein
MKKVLIVFSLLAVLAGCTSNEKKAKSLIKDYMKTHLNDPKSYEAVEFGTLDTLFSKLEHDFDYIKYNEGFKAYLKMQEDAMTEIDRKQSLIYTYENYSGSDEYNLDMEYAKMYLDSMKLYAEKIKIIHNNFKPEFNGWTMQHSYRAKNGLGALMLYTNKINFDKELTKITNTSDLD